MDKRIIQVPVTMQPAVRKADDSVKLSFTTNIEIPTEEYMVMDTYRKSSGWLLFAENSFDINDVPKEQATDSNGKSKSQRLRNSLYVLYKQNHPDGLDADAWIDRAMEKIIQDVQSKIDS